MDSFEQRAKVEVFGSGQDKPRLPMVVMAATNTSGSFTYQLALGRTSLNSNSGPVKLDSIFWVASCTKLVTTIAVLQCVERGLLRLDEEISRILPEWLHPEILVDIAADDRPILKKAENPATMRLLLTHTSGAGYDSMSTLLHRYRKLTGRPPSIYGKTVQERFHLPLLCEPGTEFVYSPSLDWAGLAVERVNGNMRLDAYIKANICDRLGLENTTFQIGKLFDAESKLLGMSTRHPDGSLSPSSSPLPYPAEDDCGGGGLFSTPSDLLKILSSILRNDGALLRPETVEMMFTPQLADSQSLRGFINGQPQDLKRQLFSGIPPQTQINWALGGLLTEEDVEGRRHGESLSWSGASNIYWWIDRKGGVAGVFGSHIEPWGDVVVNELYQEFERAVYQELSRPQSTQQLL